MIPLRAKLDSLSVTVGFHDQCKKQGKTGPGPGPASRLRLAVLIGPAGVALTGTP
jgi:hypothetical protein